MTKGGVCAITKVSKSLSKLVQKTIYACSQRRLNLNILEIQRQNLLLTQKQLNKFQCKAL